MIEMIVVLVIIAIMAALAIPRMTGNEQREFKLAVDQVSDLLTMFAQRQQLSQKIVGIHHDVHRHSVELVILDTYDSSSARNATWRRDPYVQPVVLPRFMYESDIAFTMNGDTVYPSEYPISCQIGQERPWIEIGMRGAGERALISLSPYGVAPTLSASFASAGVHRGKLDLDNTGRSREDW